MEESGQEALKTNSTQRVKNNYHKKREEEQSILKKAIDLQRQNRKLSFEENDVVRKAEEIKAKRLKNRENAKQYYHNRKAAATPEEMETLRLKRLEQNKQWHLKQNAITSPEEKEALRVKRFEQNRKYRQTRREKEASIFKKATPEEKEATRVKRFKQYRKYRQIKREKEDSILKEALELSKQKHELSLQENEIVKKAEEIKDKRKLWQEKEKSILTQALELSKQKREMSLEENEILRRAEEIKAKRLKISQKMIQYHQNKKAAATPEEIEARRLKKLQQNRCWPQKRIFAATPEVKEARRLRKLEQNRKYKQVKREKEKTILKKAMELLTQNQELTLEEKEILKKAEEIKARRLKMNKYLNECLRKRTTTAPAPEEAKTLGIERKREESKVIPAMELSKQNHEISSDEKLKAGELKTREYIKTIKEKTTRERQRTDQVFDEIKIEKEVIQETRINAILANSNHLRDLQQGCFNDSSCSWLDHSEKSFMTDETIKTQSSFQSFQGGLDDGCKFDLEKSFRCMKALIDATAKRDGHFVFGQQIAQKLRSSKKNATEVDVAKQLIDDILKNLAVGAYSIDTKEV